MVAECKPSKIMFLSKVFNLSKSIKFFICSKWVSLKSTVSTVPVLLFSISYPRYVVIFFVMSSVAGPA